MLTYSLERARNISPNRRVCKSELRGRHLTGGGGSNRVIRCTLIVNDSSRCAQTLKVYPGSVPGPNKDKILSSGPSASKILGAAQEAVGVCLERRALTNTCESDSGGLLSWWMHFLVYWCSHCRYESDKKNMFYILKEQTPFLIAQPALFLIQRYYWADVSSIGNHDIRDSELSLDFWESFGDSLTIRRFAHILA